MGLEVRDLGRKTWQIDEYHVVSMYLIEGDEKAMLIDTGAGIGDLKAVVDRLTDKPLIVVNTHGHLDHTGGNMQFPETWMDFDDLEMDRKMNTYETRMGYAESRVRAFCPDELETALASVQKQKEMHYRELKEGMVFELGNRPVEIIKTPGHSVGSVALLDRNYHQMFTGDMVNFQVLMFKGMGAPMQVYADSLKKMMARSSEFDRILRGHEKPEGTVDDMKQLLAAVEAIMDGSDTGEYKESKIHKGWVVTRGDFSVWYEGPEGKTMKVE